MPIREANAVWEGTLKKGRGTFRLPRSSWEGQYTFSSRFESGEGTNPEELVGAAHAGCFSMALAGMIADEGYEPEVIRTKAEVNLDKTPGGWGIESITLVTTAVVPEMGEKEFEEVALKAKKNCPVSRALAGTRIELDAKLAEEIEKEAGE